MTVPDTARGARPPGSAAAPPTTFQSVAPRSRCMAASRRRWEDPWPGWPSRPGAQHAWEAAARRASGLQRHDAGYEIRRTPLSAHQRRWRPAHRVAAEAATALSDVLPGLETARSPALDGQTRALSPFAVLGSLVNEPVGSAGQRRSVPGQPTPAYECRPTVTRLTKNRLNTMATKPTTLIQAALLSRQPAVDLACR